MPSLCMYLQYSDGNQGTEVSDSTLPVDSVLEPKRRDSGMKVMETWDFGPPNNSKPIKKKPMTFLPPDKVKLVQKKEVSTCITAFYYSRTAFV